MRTLMLATLLIIASLLFTGCKADAGYFSEWVVDRGSGPPVRYVQTRDVAYIPRPEFCPEVGGPWPVASCYLEATDHSCMLLIWMPHHDESIFNRAAAKSDGPEWKRVAQKYANSGSIYAALILLPPGAPPDPDARHQMLIDVAKKCRVERGDQEQRYRVQPADQVVNLTGDLWGQPGPGGWQFDEQPQLGYSIRFSFRGKLPPPDQQIKVTGKIGTTAARWHFDDQEGAKAGRTLAALPTDLVTLPLRGVLWLILTKGGTTPFP